MNNNLNFRIWNEESKCFENSDNIAINCSGGLIRHNIWYDDSNGGYVDESWNEELREGYVVQQCTGLTDKHGKLIFEGDIICHNDREERLVIQWREEYASFGGIIYLEFDGFDENGKETWRSPDYDSYRDMDEFTLNDCGEVIGNVFENQELLK